MESKVSDFVRKQTRWFVTLSILSCLAAKVMEERITDLEQNLEAHLCHRLDHQLREIESLANAFMEAAGATSEADQQLLKKLQRQCSSL